MAASSPVASAAQDGRSWVAQQFGLPVPQRVCSRCAYDDTTPRVSFDAEGICNYCRMIDGLQTEYATGTEAGRQKFLAIVGDIKREGKGRKYDCVVGVSGGTDSSFMLKTAVELGLRPLAAHYDNTWNTAIATENIRKVTAKLKVDLYTHVVDNREIDDIFKAFLKASVPELDGCTDIALAEVLYRAAEKAGVRYVLEGHSFRAEGVSPLGTMYIDGKYISSVHKRFGTRKMKTFPNMPLGAFMKWTALRRIKKIRPLWYIEYSKEEARASLTRDFGWQYYGGHHLENRMTAFHHSYYLPRKFGVDTRVNSLSASVRSGKMSREDALAALREPPYLEPDLLEYFKKRLGLTDEELSGLLSAPPKFYKEYPTYKRTFERMRPIFWLMYRANLVPKSFYLKYTSRSEI